MTLRTAPACSPALVALLLLAAAEARAQSSVNTTAAPLLFDQVQMPRTAAMAGAQSAVATSNDAIMVNPAGLAQGRRYHIEADGVLDPQFPGAGVLVSVVDSTSLAVASGLSFARYGAGQLNGRYAGWTGSASYAYNLGGYFFGGTTRYIHFDGPDGPIHAFAQDFGLLIHRGSFAIAAVGQNLAFTNVQYFPPTFTGGIAFGSDSDYHLAIDYKADFTDSKSVRHKLAAGYEMLIDQTVAPRVGVAYDFTRKNTYFAFGAGLLSEKGGLSFSYQRRIQGGFEHFYELGLTLYLE